MSTPKTILVTGANKGIGYEAVNLLSQKLPTSTILLGTRSVENGQNAIRKMREASGGKGFENVTSIQLDVDSRESVENAVKKVKADYGKLDVLLHNSGIANVGGDAYAKGVFDVNVTGTKTVVDAFLPLIPTTGQIIVVSSEVGTWMMGAVSKIAKPITDTLDDPSRVTWDYIQHLADDFQAHATSQPAKENWPATSRFVSNYCISKMLQTAWVRAFARQHPELKVALVCPGYCATELNGFSGPRSAAQGGESVTWPVFHEFENGRLYQDGKVLPFTAPVPEDLFK
ncbi:uncharacterized protein EV422DRAFT_574419 [Fimicolochytrium jonesii]|uniref:uncharacterized protein n=1 Tax=Fimicolochytrium jonesii TaxID=1396493 RepID=UPI0022FE0DDE|nr:uncharacterized protein EV422DRAFT_574419 [Fimicolochytrium jonesii]KAI8818171.1 hypothetical protein EV422DRAFT_574419 [Fimicolochytrium jonesii]